MFYVDLFLAGKEPRDAILTKIVEGEREDVMRNKQHIFCWLFFERKARLLYWLEGKLQFGLQWKLLPGILY